MMPTEQDVAWLMGEFLSLSQYAEEILGETDGWADKLEIDRERATAICASLRAALMLGIAQAAEGSNTCG